MISRAPSSSPRRLRLAVVLAAAGIGFGMPSLASAQPPNIRFEHLDQEDGLSQGSVHAVLQDRQGFVWLGTQDGLNRWDGRSLEVHLPRLGEPSTYAANYVLALAEDEEGQLWVGTDGGGLWRYDPSSGRLEGFSHRPVDPHSLVANRIDALLVDRRGRLWVGTDRGLDRFDRSTGRFVHYSTGVPEPGVEGESRPMAAAAGRRTARVQALHEDRDGRIWVGTRDGLFRVEESHTDLAAIDPPTLGSEPGRPSPWVDGVRAMVDHPRGGLWVATTRQLVYFDPESERWARFGHETADEHGFSGRTLRDLLLDRDGRVWIATREGLFLHRPVDGPPGRSEYRFHHFRHDPSDSHSLAGDELLTLYEDRSGLLWAGTLNAGADRWHPSTWAFGNYRGAVDSTIGLTSNKVYAFTEDRAGRAFIGTFGGLFEWDRRAQILRRRSVAPDEREGGSVDQFTSLMADDRDRVWFGTRSTGLGYLGPVPSAPGSAEAGPRPVRRFRHDPGDGDSLSRDAITTLFQAASGTIWVGTYGGGLDRWLEEPSEGVAAGRFEHFRADPGNPGSLPGDQVTCLAEDRTGRLWVGTNNTGLAFLDATRRRFVSVPLRPPPSNPNGRRGLAGAQYGAEPGDPSWTSASDTVYTLHFDAEGSLWIGTAGRGLLRLTEVGNGAALSDPGVELHHWTAEDGLANNTVYGILDGNDGAIWMSTNNGLSRFGPATETFTNFTARHGLQGQEFNQGAYFAAPSGRLYFGGPDGFNSFVPNELHEQGEPPPIALSSLEVSQLELDRPPHQVEALELDHRQTTLAFGVAVLDFAHPELNQYAYRLEGFDEDWVEVPPGRPPVYTKLPAGSYVFAARGADADGNWSERTLRLAIEVEPAPWRTWWAFTAYLALIAGLGYAGYRRRIEGLRRRSVELEGLVAQRTRELSDTVDQLSESETSAHVARRRALKSLEEALDERRKAQAADRAKSAFLSSMSHELRTPLNAVLGFAQLMERDDDLSAEHRENLSVILRSGEHLLSLIDDVLSLSKIEAGRLGLSHAPFDPRALADTLAEMVRVPAEEKGLELRVTTDRDLPAALLGDAGRLTQVLLNLLGNAVKFTRQGRVELGVSWRDGRIGFFVADTGPGISDEELADLFEPFVQTEVGRRSRSGTGLGLAISHELVAAMGGRLVATSELGVGSRFEFELELETTDSAAPGPSQAEESGRVVDVVPGQALPRILIVDDADENRELLSRLHRAVGLETRTASDGREGFETWKSWRPHFVWMDMRMPEMDGYEATRRIRATEAQEEAGRAQEGPGRENGRTVIVAATATAFEHDRQEILAAGCDDVLTKPFREAALFAMLENHLGLRFERRQAAFPVVGLPAQRTGFSTRDSRRRLGAETRRPTAADSSRATALRVLIAEDSQANQMVAQRMLDRLGHRTKVVSDGVQAVEIAVDEGPFDMIFMDVRMPEMDGLEATRRIRQALAPARQPVIIALTGLASESERQDCLDAGMDAVLAKPFRLADIERTVERWQALRETGAAGAAGDTSSEDRPSSAARLRETKPIPPVEPTLFEDLHIDRAIDRGKLEQLHRLDEDATSDSLTSQVIALYLDTVPGQVDDLRAAVAARDRHRWRKVAHSLKNSSATLGADSVSATCRELEELGRVASPSSETYQRADETLGRLVNEVRRALRALAALDSQSGSRSQRWAR